MKASLRLDKQVSTEEFLVVAGVDVLVGEERVGPADTAAQARGQGLSIYYLLLIIEVLHCAALCSE